MTRIPFKCWEKHLLVWVRVVEKTWVNLMWLIFKRFRFDFRNIWWLLGQIPVRRWIIKLISFPLMPVILQNIGWTGHRHFKFKEKKNERKGKCFFFFKGPRFRRSDQANIQETSSLNHSRIWETESKKLTMRAEILPAWVRPPPKTACRPHLY